MNEEAVVHQVIKETWSFWQVLWPSLCGVLTLVVAFLAMYIPHRDLKNKEFQDQKRAKEIEDAAKAPKYLEVGEFKSIMDPFASGNEAAHAKVYLVMEGVQRRLGEALTEFGNTQIEVKDLGRELNKVGSSVEVLKSKVEDMPKNITGMMLEKIYHIDPSEKRAM